MKGATRWLSRSQESIYDGSKESINLDRRRVTSCYSPHNKRQDQGKKGSMENSRSNSYYSVPSRRLCGDVSHDARYSPQDPTRKIYGWDTNHHNFASRGNMCGGALRLFSIKKQMLHTD